jgi:outer membrane protein assembly factor BamB
MKPLLRILVPAIAVLAAAVSLVLWLATARVGNLQARVPGLDRPASAIVMQRTAGGAGQLQKGPGQPAVLPGSWPSFRGADRSNIVSDRIALARQWASGGPKLLWSVALGEGHAGAAVHEGRVYVLDYDRDQSVDALRCLSLADGQEIWRYTYPVLIKRNHGMSRTVPAVAAGHVVALGPMCQVTCLDAVAGECRWTIDLVVQYGTTVPQWYAGQCPLIDGDRVILAPGGKNALLLAVDLKTGRPLWQTPNERRWEMTHVSVMPQTIKGRRTYVYCGSGGVMGVDALTGQRLWETMDWTLCGGIATVPSPVCLPDGRVFLCGGYNAGSLMLQVNEVGGTFTAQPRFRLKAREFSSTQHTPILFRDHLYGVRENDKELVCLNLDGKVIWRSGTGRRFSLGRGPYLIADELLFVLDEEGELTIAEASPSRYKELGRAKVLEGPDAWGPMALVAGRLLARDTGRLVCLDVRQP